MIRKVDMSLRNNAIPWSYSKLSTWESCRRSYKYRYIDNMRIPPGSSAQRGIDVHKACESFVNGEITSDLFADRLSQLKCKVSESLFHYIQVLESTHRGLRHGEFKNDTSDTELKIKVDQEFNPVAEDSKDYYATFIFDMLIQHGDHIEVLDYKTGKIYEDSHEFQAAIYAYAVYCITGIIPRIVFIYLDQDFRKPYVFSNEDLEVVDNLIHTYLKQIDEETEFSQTTDGSKCHWCSYKTICKGMGIKS